MKIQNLGMDDLQSPDKGDTVVIEISEEEAYTSKEEIKDVSDKVKEIENKLAAQETEDEEARRSAALTILEKERELQAEREKEWKKEKRKKRFWSNFKMVVLFLIAAVLLLALLGGYRIPVPDSWVTHFQGIWETAVSYFTGETGLGGLVGSLAN